MDMVNTFIVSLQSLFQWTNLLSCGIGSIIGYIIGACPGIGPSVGIALVIPFTMNFTPAAALTMFMGIYMGAEFGGCVASILLNVPGTGSAAATLLDGFPMAKQGRAITALSIGTTASFFGGFIAPLLIIIFLPYMAKFMLFFGTPEFFLLGVLGIICIAAVKDELLKGLICGGFGLMIGTVGMGPQGGMRFTFKILALADGFGYLPAIMGLFGIAEMIKLMGEKNIGIAETITLSGSRLEGIKLTFKYIKTCIKSVFIGLFIGLVPGVGGTTASFFSWAEAKRASKDPESFGKGNPEGVVATESSNNSVVPGALIPTLAFGIPGSNATAIVLGGLMMHGLQPGRAMFVGDGLIMTEMILISLMLSSLFILILGLGIAPYLGKITLLRKEVLVPSVFIIASCGIYLIEHGFFHVLLILCFGVFGYFLSKAKFPLFPMILSLILRKIIEDNLLRSLRIGEGSLMYFFKKPLTVVIMLLILLVLFSPVLSNLIAKIKKQPRKPA